MTLYLDRRRANWGASTTPGIRCLTVSLETLIKVDAAHLSRVSYPVLIEQIQKELD